MAVSERVGIGFPFRRGPINLPEVSYGNDSVDDSLRALLFTARGERVMNGDIGTRVHEFVFENMSALLEARISQDIRNAIARHEPRAQVLRIDVSRRQKRGTVQVDIIYRVIGQNDSRTVTVDLGNPGV